MYAEAVIIVLFLLSSMAVLVLNFTFVRTWRPKEQGMLIVALTVSVIVLPASVGLWTRSSPRSARGCRPRPRTPSVRSQA